MLWSSCTRKNLNAAIEACWPELNRAFFLDILSQETCRKADFCLADMPRSSAGRDTSKPIFLKCLMDFWLHHSKFNAKNTMLVDDTRYKSMLNPWECCTCPPSFDPEEDDQDPHFLTTTLLPWLTRWRMSENRALYAAQHMLFNPMDTLSNAVMEYHQSLIQGRVIR